MTLQPASLWRGEPPDVRMVIWLHLVTALLALGLCTANLRANYAAPKAKKELSERGKLYGG